jgi:single-strand DNA-binding protein
MLNKVMFIGNLTRDPEARRTNNGTSVVKLGIAINRKWKDGQGNPMEETVFVDVDVWAKTADFCRDYLRKGNRVFIEGRLKLDTWQDQSTGQNRSRLGVVAESVQNLSPRQEAAPPAYPPQQQPQYQQPAPPPQFPEA